MNEEIQNRLVRDLARDGFHVRVFDGKKKIFEANNPMQKRSVKR